MASSISDRVHRLELLISMLEELGHRLSYLQSTMLGLMTTLAAQSRFAELRLAEPCRVALLEGRSFSESWHGSVTAQRDRLGGDAADVLLSLGDVLGRADLESQMASIACAKELLEERLGAAREERGKKAPLFRTVGVLSGVGIAILLI